MLAVFCYHQLSSRPAGDSTCPLCLSGREDSVAQFSALTSVRNRLLADFPDLLHRSPASFSDTILGVEWVYCSGGCNPIPHWSVRSSFPIAFATVVQQLSLLFVSYSSISGGHKIRRSTYFWSVYQALYLSLYRGFTYIGGADKNVPTKIEATLVISWKTHPRLTSHCSRILYIIL